MELKIKTMSIPEVIDFNFEELKTEVEAKASEYVGLVYTDDKIKEAKTDIANLRKFVKALSDERIKVKKECLKPYETFEAKINELTAIVNKPINMIDLQIKQYEEDKKARKNADICDYWQECEELGRVPDHITLMMVFDEKWLNASTSMKSVQDAIDTKLTQIKTDIATLDNLPTFGFEAKQEYLRHLDLGRAIAEGQRLADIQKQKEEYERTQAAKLAEMAAAKKVSQQETIATPKCDPEEEAYFRFEFWVNITKKQAEALHDFFENNNINYGQIRR